MFGFGRQKTSETRSIENPKVPISSENIIAFLGLGTSNNGLPPVSVDSALGVPAIWGASNFLSGTLAGTPIHMFKRSREGRERVRGTLAAILQETANEESSSFEWRKYLWDCVFTHGRGLSYIERNAAGTVINIWPLEPTKVTIKRREGRKVYIYKDGTKTIEYRAHEIIDIPFMLKEDRLSSRSPITSNQDVISVAIEVTRYGAKFFQNGGVPPFAIEGNFQTAGGMQAAVADLEKAVAAAAKENRLALAMPKDHKVTPLGAEPEKMQLVEWQRFIIEQIARIYSIPPTFLQDLTHGTFSNTEQQDLQFVKHTLKRWVEQFEQELNLKLLGRSRTPRTRYIEMNLDGLLRGDFKTRMEGLAQAIQNAIMTPQEARDRMNLGPADGADQLLVQGATVPLAGHGNAPQEGDDGT